MLEFLPREQSMFFCLLCLIGYGIIYLIFQPARKYPYSIKRGWRYVGLIMVLILCLLFVSVSDWFAYYEEFLYASEGGETHMESIYEWLASNTPNYLIWRLCIWGIALVILLLIFKQFQLPYDLCVLVFVAFGLLRFAYNRAALAYSFLFLGCAILSNPKKHNLLYSLLAIASMSFSFFLHKTAMLGIAIVIVSIVIRKIDSKTIVLFLLIVPILLLILRGLIADYMMMDVGNEDGEYYSYLNNGQQYLHGFGRRDSMAELINSIISRVPLIIFGGVCVTQCNNTNIPKQIRFFMRISLFLVLASVICLINLGASTYILYYRLLNYSVIPIVICFSYLYINNYKPKLLNIIYYTLLTSAVFELSYAVYDRYVNGTIMWF